MKVLITGAAGRLGRYVVSAVSHAGHVTRATDRAEPSPGCADFILADLRDAQAAREVAEGMDAIVHLGNHPNPDSAHPERIFAENCAINAYMMQVAVACGVRVFLFASSIQAVNTGVNPATGDRLPPPYLPFDSRMPHSAGNSYAVSKVAAELLIEMHVSRGFPSGVAIRFPWIISRGPRKMLLERGRMPAGDWNIPEVAYLRVEDAADFIVALLERPPAGFRTFLPASPDPVWAMTAEEVRQRYFAGVPVRGAPPPLERIVDCDEIVAATGWRPRRSFEDEFDG